MPGEGLVLTGQLGDVMKESAQIALSAVRSQADRLEIEQSAFEQKFHVHVPAGAIPKDGPAPRSRWRLPSRRCSPAYR